MMDRVLDGAAGEMCMSKRLEGKWAIIPGGGSGSGAGRGRVVAREGARVAVTYIRPPAGEAIVAEIIAAGGEALFVEHDVASEASWAAAVEKTVDRFGALTTLVNNAGLNHMRGVEDETVEGWNHIVSIDQMGTWLGMRAAMPHLRASGNGAIDNISSILGIMATVTCLSFHAAKGADRKSTRLNSSHYSALGVRVRSDGNT